MTTVSFDDQTAPSIDELIQMAQKEPTAIVSNGQEVVMLPKDIFDKIWEIAEDTYWIEEAKKGSEEGYLSEKESEAFLQELDV